MTLTRTHRARDRRARGDRHRRARVRRARLAPRARRARAHPPAPAGQRRRDRELGGIAQVLEPSVAAWGRGTAPAALANVYATTEPCPFRIVDVVAVYAPDQSPPDPVADLLSRIRTDASAVGKSQMPIARRPRVRRGGHRVRHRHAHRAGLPRGRRHVHRQRPARPHRGHRVRVRPREGPHRVQRPGRGRHVAGHPRAVHRSAGGATRGSRSPARRGHPGRSTPSANSYREHARSRAPAAPAARRRSRGSARPRASLGLVRLERLRRDRPGRAARPRGVAPSPAARRARRRAPGTKSGIAVDADRRVRAPSSHRTPAFGQDAIVLRDLRRAEQQVRALAVARRPAPPPRSRRRSAERDALDVRQRSTPRPSRRLPLAPTIAPALRDARLEDDVAGAHRVATTCEPHPPRRIAGRQLVAGQVDDGDATRARRRCGSSRAAPAVRQEADAVSRQRARASSSAGRRRRAEPASAWRREPIRAGTRCRRAACGGDSRRAPARRAGASRTAS